MFGTSALARLVMASALTLTLPAQAESTCDNRVLDGPESDVDCGGDCSPCEHGRACRSARDCASGRCAAYVCEERAYIDGDPIPPGYRVAPSDGDSSALVRKLGIVALGVGYGAAWTSALALPGELSILYVPVVGPWIAISRDETPKPGLIALNGGLQTVGAALLIGGLLTGGDQLIRSTDVAGARDVRLSAGPNFVGGYEVSVSGAF
jgi:hypothetical protein